MLKDPGSPTSSFLADQELFNRQSPGRRRNDISKINSSSFSSTPNAIRTSKRTIGSPSSSQKFVTIFDHIFQWFHAEITNRNRLSSIVCGLFSTILFLFTTSLLKFSIWSPFSSSQDAFSWALRPLNWFPLFLHIILAAAVSLFIISTICKVDQQPRLAFGDHLAWAAVGIEFVHRLISTYMILFLSNDLQQFENFAFIAISFGIFVSSVVLIFRHDFQLTFLPVQVNSVRTFVQFVKSTHFSSFFEQCGIDSAIPFTATILFVIFIGPIMSGFSTWWLLLQLRFYLNLIVIFGSHQFYAKVLMKIVNQTVMKPIEFPFPPPFTVHSPTPEQTRTLTNVIEIDDPMLKIFALYDLRTIAWSDESRRRQIFSLSQPGGHARNWKSVSSVCVRLLDELCSRMTAASARLVGYSWSDQANDEDLPKNALLMPKKMREMAFGGAGNVVGTGGRNVGQIRALNAQNGTLINKIIKKVVRNEIKPAISRFEAQLNSYAAEAIYMLVVVSMGEDRFGVVQKDLKDLITLICKLIASIDMYERARASVADKSDITYLKMVDSSLQSSLQRVVATFGSHLRSLNLSEDHIRTILLVCQLEEF